MTGCILSTSAFSRRFLTTAAIATVLASSAAPPASAMPAAPDAPDVVLTHDPQPTTDDSATGTNSDTAPPDDKAPVAKPPRDTAQAEENQIVRREQRLKRLMSSFGVDDDLTQAAIIGHLKSEVAVRQQVRDQVSQLYRLLRDKKTPDEQLRQLTAQLQTEFYLDRQRRLDAEARLDTQILYSQRPRCEAMLMLLGIIGDGPLMVTLPAPRSTPRLETTRLEPPRLDTAVPEPTASAVVETPRPESRIMEQERERQEIIRRFDGDGDGRLNPAEELAAYQWLREHPPETADQTANPRDAE